MEILAAFEIAVIVLTLIGVRLLRRGGSDHGALQRIGEAIAIGVLAGTLAPLLVGAAPWALLGGIALVVVGV